MTREELEKQLSDREAVLLKKEGAETPTLVISPDAPVVPKADETVVPEVKPVTPDPQANKEMDDLKAKLAASETRQADLQARLDRQSGEFGGNLDKMRNQVKEVSEAYTALKSQYDALLEKAKQPQQVTAKVVTDDLRAAFPEAAEAIEQTITALKNELATVKQVGEEGKTKAQQAEQSAQSLAKARFSEKLYSVIPDFDALNVTPEWKAFVSKPDAYGRTLVDDLNASWGSNAAPIITAVKEFRASQVSTTPSAEEIAAKAKADADKADKLKAETAPTQAAGTRKTEQSAANDATKARQERIAAYKAKVQRDFTAVTQKEMDQYKADSDEELKHKLSLAGYEK